MQCRLVVCRQKAKLHLEQILVMINKPPKWNDQVTTLCRSWRQALRLVRASPDAAQLGPVNSACGITALAADTLLLSPCASSL